MVLFSLNFVANTVGPESTLQHYLSTHQDSFKEWVASFLDRMQLQFIDKGNAWDDFYQLIVRASVEFQAIFNEPPTMTFQVFMNQVEEFKKAPTALPKSNQVAIDKAAGMPGFTDNDEIMTGSLADEIRGAKAMQAINNSMDGGNDSMDNNVGGVSDEEGRMEVEGLNEACMDIDDNYEPFEDITPEQKAAMQNKFAAWGDGGPMNVDFEQIDEAQEYEDSDNDHHHDN